MELKIKQILLFYLHIVNLFYNVYILIKSLNIRMRIRYKMSMMATSSDCFWRLKFILLNNFKRMHVSTIYLYTCILHVKYANERSVQWRFEFDSSFTSLSEFIHDVHLPLAFVIWLLWGLICTNQVHLEIELTSW